MEIWVWMGLGFGVYDGGWVWVQGQNMWIGFELWRRGEIKGDGWWRMKVEREVAA